MRNWILKVKTMKQIILILSMVIAAFIAACGKDNSQSLRMSKSRANSVKTVEQLEKASSDQELQNMAKRLEAKKDLQVPDIIAEVNRVFGTTKIKDIPKSKTSEDKLLQKSEVPENENKPLAVPEVEVSNIGLEKEITLGSVKSESLTKAESVKSVCVGTCDVQIQIVKNVEDSGQVSAIKAYVVTRIADGNVKIVNSKLKNKTLSEIVSVYNSSTQAMSIKILMKNGSQDLLLHGESYTYDANTLPQTRFSESETGDSGTLRVSTSAQTKKFMQIEFDIDGDKISIELVNDFGVFGRNSTEGITLR